MFSKRLKYLRNKKGLSQQNMADFLGISRQGYGKYEKGESETDFKTTIKLADFFGVTTDYLLGKSNDPSLTEKDEKDIAKRLEQFKRELENTDGLAFDGEPMSEEAKESLMDAMEYAFKTTQKINKKYIPKKYRKDDDVD